MSTKRHSVLTLLLRGRLGALVLALLVLSRVHAQVPVSTIMRSVPGTPVTTTSIASLAWTEPSTGCTNQVLEGRIALVLDPNALTNAYSYDLSVIVEINGNKLSDPGDPFSMPVSITAELCTLQVCHRISGGGLAPYAIGETNCDNEDMLRIPGLTDCTVEIVSMDIAIGGTPSVPSELPQNCFIDISIAHHYTCPLSVDPISDFALTPRTCTEDEEDVERELRITWEPLPGAVGYDLEWLFVSDRRFTRDPDEPDVMLDKWDEDEVAYDFNDGATRVSLNDRSDPSEIGYRLPLVFDDGWLIFRIRAVGRDPLFPDRPVYGEWSGSATTGDVFDAAAKWQVRSHEGNKPWSYSATYAEDGKRKEVITYADGTSRDRETLTRLNSQDLVIAGHTIYDRAGRPAITTLPTPMVKGQCYDDVNWVPIKYHPQQAMHGEDVYDWHLFDPDGEGCAVVVPPPMSGEVQYYYSEEFAEDATDPDLCIPPPSFVPDADGYVFSQTEFTPDASGRVKRKGSVGAELQNQNGHATQMLYGQPDQASLDRLFGPQAGVASFYQKVVTMDPNEQVTVSYMDAAGHTVATSLAGETPKNLLDVYDGTAPEVTTTSDLFASIANATGANAIDLTDRSIRFTTSFTVDQAVETHTFNYDIDELPQVFSCGEPEDEPPPPCFDCIYDLSIQLTNECNEIVWEVGELVGHFVEDDDEVNFECASPTNPEGWNSDPLELPFGEYTLTKTLTVNEEARATYLEKVLSFCVTPLDDVIVSYQGDVVTTGCDIDCEECATSLGSREAFIANQLGTSADYDAALAACRAPCEVDTWCEMAYALMIEDMCPNGQYAKGVDTDNDGVLDAANDWSSVYKEQNYLRNRFRPSGEPALAPLTETPEPMEGTWRWPRVLSNGTWIEGYFDENGTPGRVQVTLQDNEPTFSPPILEGVEPELVDGELYVRPEQLLHLEDLIIHWNKGWARSLIYLHPEFQYYEQCKRYDVRVLPDDRTTSDGFDRSLIRSTTYEEAETNGLFVSGVPLPYASLGVGTDDRLQSYADPYIVHATELNPVEMDHFLWKYEHYLSVNNNWLSMPEAAAYIVRTGGTYAFLVDVDKKTDFGGTAGVAAGVEDAVNDQEWTTFKQIYLDEKYRAQKKHMDRFTLDGTCDHAGNNACIGHPVNWVNDFIQDGGNTGQLYDACQPCQLYTTTLYNKQKRFQEPEELVVNLDANAIGYQSYLQSGVCPVGQVFEQFLNDVFRSEYQSQLLANVDEVTSFAAMVQVMNLNATLGPVPVDLVGTITTPSSTTWELAIADADPPMVDPWECHITLELPGTPALDWADLISLSGLHDVLPNGSGTDLKIYAVFSQVGGPPITVELTGTTCYPINACQFEDVCESNAVGRSITELMQWLAVAESGVDQPLTQPTFTMDPEEGPYNGLLGSALFEVFGVPAASVDWHFVSGTPAFQMSLGSDVIELKVADYHVINGGLIDGEVFDPHEEDHWRAITSLSNFRVSHQNTFLFEVIAGVDNTVIAEITAEAWFVSGSDRTPVFLGECGPPIPAYCQSNDHLITRSIFEVVADRLQHHWSEGESGVAEMNLFASASMTPLLANTLAPLLVPDQDPDGTPFVTDDTPDPQTTGSLGVVDYDVFNVEGKGCLEIWIPDGAITGAIDHITGPDFSPESADDQTAGYDDRFMEVHVAIVGGGTVDVLVRTHCLHFTPCVQCPLSEDDAVLSESPNTIYGNDLVLGDGGFVEENCTTLPPYLNYLLTLQTDAPGSWILRWREQFDPTSVTWNTLTGNYYFGYPYLDTHEAPDPDIVQDTWTIQPIPFGLTIEQFEDLDQESLDCAGAYFNYLYGTYLHPAPSMDWPSEPPIPLDQFCEIFHNGCYDAFVTYSHAVNNFNELTATWFIDGGSTPVPEITEGYYACSAFTALGLCNCVDEYVALLNLVLGDGVVTQAENDLPELREMALICTMPPPCAPAPPALISPDPPTEYEDPCVLDLQLNATQNATNAYEHSLVTTTQDFLTRYDEHCLNSVVEHFEHTFTHNEYQYTLYYYDRAGSLVRTVPPEGVEPIDLTVEQEAIDADREGNTMITDMEHRLTSDRMYNSLGQLTREHVPDRVDMPVVETLPVTGIPEHLNITHSQFVSENVGFLAGEYLVDHASPTPDYDRGLLMRTQNGGNSWQRVDDLLAADLNDVTFFGSAGYAVGNNGTVLRSLDAGTSWELTGPALDGTPKEFYATLFEAETKGLIAGEGVLGYTLDGGSFDLFSPTGAPAERFTGLAHDVLDTHKWYASSWRDHSGRSYGSLYHTSDVDDADDWDPNLGEVTSLDLRTLCRVDDSHMFIGGAQGALWTWDDVAKAAYMVNTHTTDDLVQLVFADETHGMAVSLINGDSVLKVTYDGGEHWALVGEMGEGWTNIQLIDQDGVDGHWYEVLAGRPHGFSTFTVVTGPDDLQSVYRSDHELPTVDVCTRIWGGYHVNDDGPPDGPRLAVVLATIDQDWIAGKVHVTVDANDESFQWYQAVVNEPVKEMVINAKWTDSPGLSGMLLCGDNKKAAPLIFGQDNAVILDVPWPMAPLSMTAMTADPGEGVYTIYEHTGAPAKLKHFTLPPGEAFTVDASYDLDGLDDADEPLDLALWNQGVDPEDRSFWICGAHGFLSVFNDLTASPLSLGKVELHALPYNDVAVSPDDGALVCVGDKGMVSYSEGAVTFDILAAISEARLNDVLYYSEDRWLAVGDGGLFVVITPGEEAVTPINIGWSTDILSIAIDNGDLYLGMADGNILLARDFDLDALSFEVLPYNMGQVRALADHDNDDVEGVCAVGEGSQLQYATREARIKVNEIYTPPIYDLSFSDASNGLLAMKLVNARVLGGGHDAWRQILGTDGMQQALSTPLAGGAALGILAKDHETPVLVNNDAGPTTTNLSITSASSYEPSELIRTHGGHVLWLGKNTSNVDKIFKLDDPEDPSDFDLVGSSIVNGNITCAWPMPNTAADVVVIGSSTGYLYTFDATSTITDLGNVPSGAGIVTQLYFRDRANGYALCSDGLLYRTDPAELEGGGTLVNDAIYPLTSSSAWLADPIAPLDDHIDGQNTLANMGINTFAFVSRTKGFVGGAYDGSPMARYARVLVDEANLYSQRFWYDRVGRLVLSQNTEQYQLPDEVEEGDHLVRRYSYTLYDDLGRVSESGEVMDDPENEAMTLHFPDIFGALVNGLPNARLIDDEKLRTWVSEAVRNDRVLTHYDEDPYLTDIQVTTAFDPEQLRNRVACTEEWDTFDPENVSEEHDHASHYSYDIHGNVKELLQELPELQLMSSEEAQRYKRFQYDYDLLSGNVNEVAYQKDQPDASFHRYGYDADNRITQAETSRDGVIWDQDATYFYYPHGPLARVELGTEHVQGLDYAYTLQGWMKGLNSDHTVDGAHDMGVDGLDPTDNTNPNSRFAPDLYAFSLGYFEGDYEPIDDSRWGTELTRPFLATDDAFSDDGARADLYNGNIAWMVSAHMKGYLDYGSMDPGSLASVYRYDQLNRLRGRTVFGGKELVVPDVYKWMGPSGSPDSHKESLSYDRNGNILALNRYDKNGAVYDELVYKYHRDDDDHLLQNRLYHYREGGIASLVVPERHATEDLEDHGTFTDGTVEELNNGTLADHDYAYDRMGRLTTDRTEGSHMRWTPRDKVSTVERGDATVLSFGYDAAGQRRSKRVEAACQEFFEVYVRDAQGNPMAQYKGVVDDELESVSYSLTERNRYGSARLGTDLLQVDPLTPTDPLRLKHAQGFMRYEVADHLGNVHITVTDHKGTSPDEKDVAVGFYAQLMSQVDYTPFGSLMPDRAAFRRDGKWVIALPDMLTSGESVTITSGGTPATLATYNAGYTTVAEYLTDIADELSYTFALSAVVVGSTVECDLWPTDMHWTTPGDVCTWTYLDPQMYRFGFQGQEKDDEIHGATGTSYSYEFRMHDPRIGRFLSIDPIASKYPFYSPYSFSGNRVIDMIELEGLEPTTPVGNWNVWFDNTNNHKQVAGRTVFEVSDKGSVERWNVARYDHGNGKIGWMYYNTSLPQGDRWRNFPAAGAADPVPAAQFAIPFQDNTPVRPGPCYGCAFDDFMQKALLGGAMGGTGLLAGGGVAGGYLLPQLLDASNETSQQLLVNDGRWGLVDWADVGGSALPFGVSELFGAAFDYTDQKGFSSVFNGPPAYKGGKDPYGALYELSFGILGKMASKSIGGMGGNGHWQGDAASKAAQYGAETLGKGAAEEAKKLEEQ